MTFFLLFQHPEFSFMLKERVCPLVIKLFSPSLKYRQGVPPPPSPAPAEKPFFPIVMRLLRIVSILIKFYYQLLVSVLDYNVVDMSFNKTKIKLCSVGWGCRIR